MKKSNEDHPEAFHQRIDQNTPKMSTKNIEDLRIEIGNIRSFLMKQKLHIQVELSKRRVKKYSLF